GDVAKSERCADRVAEHPRGDAADELTVPPDGLIVIEEPVRFLESECHHAAAHAGLALSAQRLAPDEAPRLVPGNRKSKAGLERGIHIADVVAPVTISLFHAQAIERMVARETQPKGLTGLDDRVVHRLCELGGDIELVPELADVSDATGTDA